MTDDPNGTHLRRQRADDDLFAKYDVPAPRYTSYPTVPYWEDNPTTEQWLEQLSAGLLPDSAKWSMYLHIPFCETLCTFCGCNTSITKDHSREGSYSALLLKELSIYLKKSPLLAERPLQQLHLGGGTPTFLHASVLKSLVESIFSQVKRSPESFEGSIEVDPRRTNRDQLLVLRDLAFNRISLGVQDFDAEIQRLINRHQTPEQAAEITKIARELGYESVNFDLIYGLPKQNIASIEKMIEITLQLKPDRIALYSFALVPWIKPAQRLFKDEDLPVGEEKRALYERARALLLNGGYQEIGMDHFALPTDALSVAAKTLNLHRNFMGYVDRRTEVLLGLGVSSISEAPGCFHQNEKVLPVYERLISEGNIPTFRGHLLSPSDRLHREQILQLMTRFEVQLRDAAQVKSVADFAKPMLEDKLAEISEDRILRLNLAGRPFLRNLCMALDQRLRERNPKMQSHIDLSKTEKKTFSSSL